nr:reverse transcriptase domain-containing protein [Tanacetum cinerariifolium]
MIQQVQNSCQFHGLPVDDANKHLDKFLHATQSIKLNGVTDDALCLYLFPHSLTHHATSWFDRLPRNSINTFEQMDKMFLALNAEMAKINKNLMRVFQVNQQVKAVTLNCETCGGPHSFSDCPATVGNTQNVYAAGAYQGSGTLPGYTITNPKEYLKGTTIPTTTSSSPVVERKIKVTKDMVHPTNNGSTKDVQPLVVPTESLILNSEPLISPIIKPVASPLSFPDLSPTCMTLELVDRSISRPVGVAEDVFVKVGELALRIGKEATTFNLDQTSRYLANYCDMTANRIDVIDMACEEYSQEVVGFFNVIASGNPTPYYDLIVSTTSSTLTPFRNNDFLLEEVDVFLALKENSTSPEVDQSYLDSERDILLLEAFLNDYPSLPPPN